MSTAIGGGLFDHALSESFRQGEGPNLLVSRDGSECVACEDGLTANEKQTNCTEDGH